jgi:hypothetical protein
MTTLSVYNLYFRLNTAKNLIVQNLFMLFAGPRAQLITRPSMSTPTTIMRPQTVAGQVTLQQPQARSHTIALQRPGGKCLQKNN